MYNSEISDAFVIPITNKISGDYGISMQEVYFDSQAYPKIYGILILYISWSHYKEEKDAEKLQKAFRKTKRKT